MNYTRKERLILWTLSAAGFLGLNTAFIYSLLFQPEAMVTAMQNPISLTFIIESFFLMGALAWLLTKWKVTRLHWGWFIALSLLGSMAFALPVVLLWPNRK
jgi:hypothetical protein